MHMPYHNILSLEELEKNFEILLFSVSVDFEGQHAKVKVTESHIKNPPMYRISCAVYV